MQVAEHHKFVALNLHVGINYAQVHAGGVQKLLVFAFRTPKKVEMALQILSRFLNVTFPSLFVIKQAQLECSFRFGSFGVSGNSDFKNRIQVLEGHRHLTVDAIDIGEHLVSLTLVLFVVVFNAELQELLKVLNSALMVVTINFFLNQSDLLVARRLVILIIRTLGDVKTLLKEL